jgi:oligopeptide transport system substrate-binding protein
MIGTLGGCGRLKTVEQEISISLPGSPVSVDPQLVNDTNSGFVASFNTACLYGYDLNKELKPVLAESVEISDDGLTYTFHLKKDLKWSDGRPLTAADFVYGFRRLADPDVGSNSVYMLTDSCTVKNAVDVTQGKIPVTELGVSAPDALTFVVELETPCPYFCALVTMCNFAPCNEDFYHTVGKKYATSADTILSCGPFIMDRYEPLAMQIHFKKNPYYVDADIVKMSGVNLQVVANAQQALMSYESGYLDITTISGELADLAVGDPELQEFPTASLMFLDINHRTCAALKNKNIRMALTKSIDRNSIVKNILKTGNQPLARVNPPGYYIEWDNKDFSGDPDQYKEQAGYDPQKAKELWEKGLSEIGESAVTLTLLYASGNDNLMESVKQQMEKSLPGLTIKLKSAPSKEVYETQTKGGYDLLFTGWFADYADPTSFLALFNSSSKVLGYNNPDYDKLYDNIQTFDATSSFKKRDEMMHQAEDMLMNDAALIPLFTKGQAYLIRNGVTGFQMTPTGVGCIIEELNKEVK